LILTPSCVVSAAPFRAFDSILPKAEDLGRVCCNHAMTGIVEQQILQEVVGLQPGQSFMRLML
jgi:hypothetical protein